MGKKIIILLVICILIVSITIFLQSRQKGFIKLESDSAQITLQGSWGRTITIGPKEGVFETHVGSYRPRQISIIKEKDGTLWRLDSYQPGNELSSIRVKKGETATIKAGEPITVKADIRQDDAKEVWISLSLTGSGGERYSPPGRKDAPKLTIVDDAGNTLASGKFEYG